MIRYQTKIKKLQGKNYTLVNKGAKYIFNQIRKQTKRQPYVRSSYFNKEKVFFTYFWQHLLQKSLKERVRRLKFFPCALDLIKNSRNKPSIYKNPYRDYEIWYRFSGITKEGEKFYVQIKKDKKTNKKYLMSCFPK